MSGSSYLKGRIFCALYLEKEIELLPEYISNLRFISINITALIW